LAAVKFKASILFILLAVFLIHKADKHFGCVHSVLPAYSKCNIFEKTAKKNNAITTVQTTNTLGILDDLLTCNDEEDTTVDFVFDKKQYTFLFQDKILNSLFKTTYMLSTVEQYTAKKYIRFRTFLI